MHPSIFKKGDPFMNRWKKWMVLGAALVLFSLNTMTVLAEENTAIQVTEEEKIPENGLVSCGAGKRQILAG